MKTKISIIVGFALLLFTFKANSQEKANTNSANSITINCTQEVFPLASSWVSQFNTLHPQQNIVLETKYASSANFSLISSKTITKGKEANWHIVLGRDIVVPVMNAANPYKNEINSRGISPKQFAQIFKNPTTQNWGTIFNGKQTETIHIYAVNDESTLSAVAKFTSVSNLKGIILGTKAEIIAAIDKDVNAVYFIKLADISNSESQSLNSNLAFIPIDKNGDHALDYKENIYSDLNTFLRGVWIGKYPKALFNTIYAVGNSQPESKEAIAFLSWILTDGQKNMQNLGFCAIGDSESQTQMDKISVSKLITPTEEASSNNAIVIILAILLVFGLLTSFTFGYFKNRKRVSLNTTDFKKNIKGFDEKAIKAPGGLFFDKSHTWSFLEKDGFVSIGLDDFIQHITGEITKVEMKKVGEKFIKGDVLFSIIQDGKQLNICAPISGTVMQQNETLNLNSFYINSSPFTEGWVYKVEPTNWLSELPFLMMAEKYKRWLNKEFSKVKDFIARSLTFENQDYATIVLQDGGEIKDGLLADCGPKIWEDFQTNILDKNIISCQCNL